MRQGRVAYLAAMQFAEDTKTTVVCRDGNAVSVYCRDDGFIGEQPVPTLQELAAAQGSKPQFLNDWIHDGSYILILS